MLEGFRIKGVPAIIPAIVNSTKNAGGQIGVRLEHYTDNDYPDPSLPVRVIGQTPKVGARGLVVFLDNMDEDFQNGYWLGSTSNRFVDKNVTPTTSDTFESKLPEGTRGLIDDSGNGQLLISKADIRIKSKTNELILTPTSFRIGNQTNSISFNDDGFNINCIKNNEVTSKLSLNNKLTEMYSTGVFLFRSNTDINIKANGNVYIGGNSTENKPVTMFHVKSSKTVLDSGSGATVIQGSQFNVKIGSSASNQLGNTAASIEVLQGNMDYSVGVGNITMRALSAAHKVKITNGFTIIGAQSYMEVTGMSATLGAELIPSLGAYFEATRIGDIKITATKNATIKSNLSMKLSSMTTADIEALVAMKLKTIKMDIIAEAMIKMQSMMLDLKAVKMIDASNHIATPGPGPFCSMPFCPILGCALTGGLSTGA